MPRTLLDVTAYWWADYNPYGYGEGIDAFLEVMLDFLQIDIADEPIEGIMRWALHLGIDSLSPRQAWVLDRKIMRVYATPWCLRCNALISWQDMAEIAGPFGNLCRECWTPEPWDHPDV